MKSINKVWVFFTVFCVSSLHKLRFFVDLAPRVLWLNSYTITFFLLGKSLDEEFRVFLVMMLFCLRCWDDLETAAAALQHCLHCFCLALHCLLFSPHRFYSNPWFLYYKSFGRSLTGSIMVFFLSCIYSSLLLASSKFLVLLLLLFFPRALIKSWRLSTLLFFSYLAPGEILFHCIMLSFTFQHSFRYSLF